MNENIVIYALMYFFEFLENELKNILMFISNFKNIFDSKSTNMLFIYNEHDHNIDLILNKKISYEFLYNIFQKKSKTLRNYIQKKLRWIKLNIRWSTSMRLFFSFQQKWKFSILCEFVTNTCHIEKDCFCCMNVMSVFNCSFFEKIFFFLFNGSIILLKSKCFLHHSQFVFFDRRNLSLSNETNFFEFCPILFDRWNMFLNFVKNFLFEKNDCVLVATKK